ncbi:MAG: YncE family protein [Polyangiaceae bacterium]
MRPVTVACLLALAACAKTKTETNHVYDAYEGGAAYPNLRPKLAADGDDFALVPNSGSDSISFLDLGKGVVSGTAPAGRNPFTLDSPHHVVGDPKNGFAYVALAYPPSSQTGQHTHGSSTRPGWIQKLSLEDLRPIGEVLVDANPGEIALSDDGVRLVVSHFDLKAAQMVDLPIDQRRATLALVDPNQILPTDSPDPTRLLVCVAPHGLALSRPDAKTAFVSCYGEDAVALVNLEDTHAAVVRVPVGAAPGPPGSPAYGPWSASLSPSGKRLAVGNTESKDVRFLDVATTVMETLVISALGAAYAVDWSPDETRLYVPTQAQDAIAVYDAATGALVRSRVLDAATCVRPSEASLGKDAAVLYVICEGDGVSPGAVLALDPVTLATRTSFPVGISPGRAFVRRHP